jgi:hypothetical protein
MHHPEAVARLMRPRSTWRDHTERGSRDHEALDWQDACLALAGCTGLAYDAFMLKHSEEPPTPALVEYLLAVARHALGSGDTVTPAQLVELLLREERAPEVQRTERHRYLACGLARGTWRYHVARPYSALAAELESLVSDAWRVARERVGESTA